MLDHARAVVGLGARPDTLEKYLDLVATSPADRMSPQKCRDLASMSGCGLVLRGLMQRAGLTHPRLLAPYRIGRAIVDVMQIASEAGALFSTNGNTSRGRWELQPGDLFLIGAPEHVGIVETVTPSSIVTIDGGSKDAQGRQIIARHTRTVQRVKNGGIVTVQGSRPMIARIDGARLQAWINARRNQEPAA